MFGPSLVNEAHLGFNRIHILFDPINKDDPTKFGINNGRSGPVGLPEINIQQGGLDFGGFTGFPQGRGDLTTVLSDTVTYLRSKKARMEESDFSATAYDKVYDAERPELFFKSLPEKVVPSGGAIGISRPCSNSSTR